MAKTSLVDVQYQIDTILSPMFAKELRESLLLGSLVSKQYEGSIGKGGDTVRVSQIVAGTGELRTIGTDADVFSSKALSTTYVDVKADKRAVSAYEFEDLVDIQSLVDGKGAEVKATMMYEMQQQINDYLFSLVNPSTSAPDHLVSGVTDFNASQVAALRKLAATAKWPKDQPWYILCDPSYYSDLLNATTLTSSDYGASDSPVINGNIGLKRFGFTIFEDDSMSTDTAIAFYPDWCLYVSQAGVQMKVSDLHSNKQFGYLLSVDQIFGAKLGISGNVKHIKVYNS